MMTTMVMMMVMTRKVVFGYVSGYIPLVKKGGRRKCVFHKYCL